MVLFTILLAMYFSVVMGVSGILWPSNSSVVHVTSTSRALKNKPLKYASIAEDIKILKVQWWRGFIHCAYLDLDNFAC